MRILELITANKGARDALISFKLISMAYVVSVVKYRDLLCLIPKQVNILGWLRKHTSQYPIVNVLAICATNSGLINNKANKAFPAVSQR